MQGRIAKMTENVVASELVAAESDDVALANVDQALDLLVSAINVIDENLPLIKAEGVPEKAAKAAIKDIMDNAMKPYLADMLKAIEVF